MTGSVDFFNAVQMALEAQDPTLKCQQVFALHKAYLSGDCRFETDFEPPKGCEAGRPQRPLLVSPMDCPKRSFGIPLGRILLIHALAHIEFNAINLALDACMRFQGMPQAYYEDWLRVAKEEAYHFQLLKTHLNAQGYEYGDFEAHNGLWEMAQKTTQDVLERMACVPRLLEARGLDVVPQMIVKFKKFGDLHIASLLEIIMRDEEYHVLIGNKWFQYACDLKGVDTIATFQDIITRFKAHIRPPFAYEARERAGFSTEELAWLKQLEQNPVPA